MNRTALSIFILTLALLPCAARAQQDPKQDAKQDVKQDVKQDAPPADGVKTFVLPPMEELHATRERPLFAPERRPDEEAPVEAEAETRVVEEKPEALNFELTGVVMGTDMAIAILKNRDTQETVHLRQGENVETWSVEAIAPRRVVLRQEEKQVTLELFTDKAEGGDEAHPQPQSPAMNRPRVPAPPQTNRQTSNQVDPAMQRNLQLRRQQQRQQMQHQQQLQEQRQDQRRAARRNLQQRRMQQNP